jgi:hypothetical protein
MLLTTFNSALRAATPGTLLIGATHLRKASARSTSASVGEQRWRLIHGVQALTGICIVGEGAALLGFA